MIVKAMAVVVVLGVVSDPQFLITSGNLLSEIK